MEVITTYCFDKNYHAIETPDFNHPLLLAVYDSVSTVFLLQHFPFLSPLLFGMPHWLARLLSPNAGAFLDVFGVLEGQIDEVLANPMALEKAEHEIIYHHLLLGNDKGERPSKKSLIEEAGVLVSAGTDTVGTACMVGTFYVLKDENKRKRLVEELNDVWPELEGAVGLEKLEKLPYLVCPSECRPRPLLSIAKIDWSHQGILANVSRGSNPTSTSCIARYRNCWFCHPSRGAFFRSRK